MEYVQIEISNSINLLTHIVMYNIRHIIWKEKRKEYKEKQNVKLQRNGR